MNNMIKGNGPLLVYEALDRLGQEIARGRIERAERAYQRNLYMCELKEDYTQTRSQIKELNQLIKLEKMIKRELRNLRAQGVDEACIQMFINESRKLRRR